MIRTANLTASVSRKAGGLFESVRRLVQSLVGTGMDVRVFGLQDEFTERDLPAWRPVMASAFKPTWPEQFGYSPRFLEELLEFGPELVHTHGIWVYPSVAANVYSKKRGCPYMISAHGMLDPWAVRNSHWKKIIAHWLYEGAHLRGARCLRALCEEEARSIRQLGLKNDIAIIPNGIDLPIGPAPKQAPWNGAVQPGQKVLLFLGRIHPKKGLANLLKAWAMVEGTTDHGPRTTDREWVLAIAGWDQGGHEAELKRLATELGLGWEKQKAESRKQKAADQETKGPKGHGLRTTDHGLGSGVSGQWSAVSSPASVVFLGPQFNEAKAACYHFCDAFVLPSLSEGVPMAVLEAWTNRKPVVMTPECNLPQGFAAGAALRVETSAASIAEGLRGLMEMADAERTVMGARGRALVEEGFGWSRIAEQMKQLYEWMLGGGPKPGCIADF